MPTSSNKTSRKLPVLLTFVTDVIVRQIICKKKNLLLMSCSTAEKEFPRRHYMVELVSARKSSPRHTEIRTHIFLLTSLSCRRRYHGAIAADL